MNLKSVQSYKPLISILNLKRVLIRPVRDNIWVEIMDNPTPHRAVRYGIYKKPDMDAKHIAYLRHAVLFSLSIFCRYAVPRLDQALRPMGQRTSVQSKNQCKSLPRRQAGMIQTIYDIVKAHGGEIRVESLPADEAGEESVGTEFIINLPFKINQ